MKTKRRRKDKMAKLMQGNLDETVATIVDAIMEETFFTKKDLTEKLRPMLSMLISDVDRPKNYDNIKTDKGILLRTIEQKSVEKDFWKHKLRAEIGQENMVKHYRELDELLIKKGFKDEK